MRPMSEYTLTGMGKDSTLPDLIAVYLNANIDRGKRTFAPQHYVHLVNRLV